MPFAGNIHYRRSKVESGGNPPLILVHGAGGSYLYWPTELRRLAGVDVVAIDLPGHGASSSEARDSISAYAEEVSDVLDRLQIEQAVIGGHSMGGAIAMQLCLDKPERVAGLILIGSGAKYEVNPELLRYCENESTYPQALQFVVKFSFSKAADKRLVELAAGRMVETPAPILHADFLACNQFDISDQLGGIEPKTLVICGEVDRMMPVSCSQILAENILDARLEIVPDAGHMVMLEQPAVVAHLVREFLEEVELDKTNSG